MQAKLLRFGVHRPNERPLVATGGDGERERVVVAGEKEQRVEQLPGLDETAGTCASSGFMIDTEGA